MRQARPTIHETTRTTQRLQRSVNKPIPQATLQPLHDAMAEAEQLDSEGHPIDPKPARKKKSR